MRTRALGLLALLLGGSVARAATHRVAVVVGNNAGAAERPLRYAESDAGRVARVLAELGQVGEDDLFLLQGQPLPSLDHALDLARERVAHWHESPGDRVLLLFYFSGHSDGEALELRGDRLTFSQLRQRLLETGADVRVAIVDSCRSGALLAAKGATPGPSFTIRLNDDLATSGQVFLASSAADEVALESATLGGSIFTHHLVTGLRGAADSSGDGRVTLAEVYQYAYQHTLSSTADTSFGAQHPEFDYRLSGQGELVLSELSQGTATLELPPAFTNAIVRDVRRDQVFAELAAGAGSRLAVEPGEYAVRIDRGRETRRTQLTIAAGEDVKLRWDELSPFAAAGGQAKGEIVEAAAAPGPPPLTLALSGGVTAGAFGQGQGPVGAVALDLAGADGLGWHLGVSAAAGQGPGFSEDGVRLLGGYRFGLHLGSFVLFAGPAVGGGVVWQMGAATYASAAGDAALEAGAEWWLDRRLALVLGGQIAAELLEGDGGLNVVPLPSGWLGVRAAL
ncbi:MAG TPA: caspase family protein [Myxococcales bacterium]|nr:caspase family protein [Myxococcales bacterium]